MRIIELVFFTGLIGCALAAVCSRISIFMDGFSKVE
jgi:hypothetical protein